MSADEARGQQESSLLRLLQVSQAGYKELLAVPAEYALEQLGAASVSLSRWERDRGLLRCMVNVGSLAPGEERFPTDETFDLPAYQEALDLTHGTGIGYNASDPDLSPVGAGLLRRYGRSAALSVPVTVNGRVWGVLWATEDAGSLAPDALARAARTADEISQMIALAERLETMARLAFQDPLTGVGNRRLLDDTLADLLAPGGPGCTVVVCDVNGLKQVNDDFGHEAGDRVLVAVADALASAARSVPGAVTVRLGGDEFAVLLPGAARTPAIQLVEAADTLLSPAGISISCGIAAAPAGSTAREAMALADSAQYSAKRRSALLLVASDIQTDRSSPRRRRSDLRPSTPPLDGDVRQAVARAVSTLAANLSEAPTALHARLEWLGEHLLEPFDLDHWSVSRADLALEHPRLMVTSLGMRVGRPIGQSAVDLLADQVFELRDYPLSLEAMTRCRWFYVDVHDEAGDAAERAVLASMAKRYVLAVGCNDGSRGSLLEVYGRSDELNLGLLGSTLGLAASAVLGRVVSQAGAAPTMMSA